MAPNIGSMEILLLAMLALAVLGPRDLPLLLRKVGRWVASARSVASEFRSEIEEMGREAEVQALQDEVNRAVMAPLEGTEGMGKDLAGDDQTAPGTADAGSSAARLPGGRESSGQ